MPPAPPARRFPLPAFLARPGLGYGAGILGATLLGVVFFDFAGMPLLEGIGMPHEYCYLRDPRLVWLHVITDSIIGLAYVSISI